MPEVLPYEGDLSEAAHLIYGPTIPAHARYAAVKHPTLFRRMPGGSQAGLIGFIALFWLFGCMCIAALRFIAAFIPSSSDGISLSTIMSFLSCLGIPAIVVGSILIWIFGGRIVGRVTGKRTGSESCRISNTQPRPGESIDVSYDLGFEGDMEVTGTTIQLLRRETVTYTAGTDRHTVSQDTVIDSQQFLGRSARKGDFLSENASFTLPADAMHTFIANRNKILWLVKVSVAIKGRPDINNLYHLIVMPREGTSYA